MLSDDIFLGEHVRLTAITKEDVPILARWHNNAGFLRLLNADAAKPQTEADVTKWLEEAQKAPNGYLFAVRELPGDALLGFVELDGILWNHGVAWLGIGVGDRERWGPLLPHRGGPPPLTPPPVATGEGEVPAVSSLPRRSGGGLGWGPFLPPLRRGKGEFPQSVPSPAAAGEG